MSENPTETFPAGTPFLSRVINSIRKKECPPRQRPHEAAVPVHPKPIVEGGRVFGEDGGEPVL